jgi:hypothetical protein
MQSPYNTALQARPPFAMAESCKTQWLILTFTGEPLIRPSSLITMSASR